MGFEDVFAGINFEDAQINLSGDGGNPDNPPAGTGQTAGTPPVTEGQGAVKDPAVDKEGVKPADEGTKPPPYDQDPKWKKARAAEAALEQLLKDNNLLSVEELKDALSKGVSLSKLLGDKDPKKLLEDADYLARVKSKWNQEETSKKYEGETPEQKAERLETELQRSKQEFENFKNGVEDKSHAEQVLKGFSKEVSKVVEVLSQDEPLTADERQLLTLYLGVDNPANEIDIEDQTAVRKMATEGVTKFRSLVKNIRQAAIDSYVAGKTGHVGDGSRANDPTKVKTGEQDGTLKKPLKNASVDEVFEAGNREFTEILIKGMEALT